MKPKKIKSEKSPFLQMAEAAEKNDGIVPPEYIPKFLLELPKLAEQVALSMILEEHRN